MNVIVYIHKHCVTASTLFLFASPLKKLKYFFIKRVGYNVGDYSVQDFQTPNFKPL